MLDTTLLNLLALLVYIVILVKGIKKRISIQKHIVVALFVVYIVGVISVTLFPLPIQKELIIRNREIAYWITNNFVPFRSIVETIVSGSVGGIIRSIIGNIVLFIPLGGFLPLLYKKTSRAGKVILWGLIVSIGIEMIQFGVSLIVGYYRMTNIDGVILNTIGAAIGFMILKLSLPITGKFIDVSHLE